jgi:uncharacterized protein YcfJ
MAPVRHKFLCTLFALPLLGACATDPYTGRPDLSGHMLGGALIGAAGGALAGHALGGNYITGAAAGMVAGGAIGAATTARGAPRRRYYRDTRGYCYYIDQTGQPKYDYNVRC